MDEGCLLFFMPVLHASRGQISDLISTEGLFPRILCRNQPKPLLDKIDAYIYCLCDKIHIHSHVMQVNRSFLLPFQLALLNPFLNSLPHSLVYKSLDLCQYF